MDLEGLATALEQIADKVVDTEAKSLKVGPGLAWHDESGDVLLVLTDGGVNKSTIAGWRDVVLVEDWQAARTTDAEHRAHAAKLCRASAVELRKSAAAIEAYRKATA